MLIDPQKCPVFKYEAVEFVLIAKSMKIAQAVQKSAAIEIE
jgi:hypothetical protein